MDVLIRNLSRKKTFPAREIRKLTKYVIESLLKGRDFNNPQVSILFVDDGRMRKLNRQFRNVDYTTDVLAFPMWDAGESVRHSDEPTPLGDVVISLEMAQRQAAHAQHSIKKEITLLLIHGFLHLLHYDDEKPQERRQMFAEQNRWLRRFLKEGLFENDE